MVEHPEMTLELITELFEFLQGKEVEAEIPLKSGTPFSILITDTPLTEEQVYQWDLKEIH